MRNPSFIIYDFIKDNSRLKILKCISKCNKPISLSRISRRVDITYSHCSKITIILLRYGILKKELIKKELKNKKRTGYLISDDFKVLVKELFGTLDKIEEKIKCKK